MDSYNYLPTEKKLNLDNAIKLSYKSVVNKHKNSYNYNIFLEKGS